VSPSLRMNNLRNDISGNPHFNRLEIGDLLFSEYTCPLETRMFGIWTDQDYLVHVVSGKKTWHTPDGSWTVSDGQTLFFKKGAAFVEQHFEADFCVLLFFIPDAIVREVVGENIAELGRPHRSEGGEKCAIPVTSDLGLDVFFDSMKSYFSGDERPSEPLLRLKLKELVLSILTSKANPYLSFYFRSVAGSEGPSLPGIMESNFRYRLSLEEFARLCHRSLSSFKRDFQKHFNEPPGRWLIQKRLDYAAALLLSAEDKNITDVVFDCGFEDVSHFSKAFKKRFGKSPSAYREEKK
jgi:AraC-like DNA-binding protein